MLDELTLYAVTVTPMAGGYDDTKVRTPTAVYADKTSAKRADWRAANEAGIKIDAIFVVNADEYNGQTEAAHDGINYRIVRTYQAALGRIELSCEVIQ